MEAIVLAGGLGTRLKDKLRGLPKPMAPVAGRPFLEFLLHQLARAGCARAILSVGYLHEKIEEHFGRGWRGMTLDYAVESEPLGTGGAIRAALGRATDESVLVLNGDTYLQADYAAMMRFHAEQAAELTIAVVGQPDVARYGGVVMEGDRIVAFAEKGRAGPGWINAGAYAVYRDLEWPRGLPAKFSFETDFLAPGIGRLRPVAYKVDGFFLDIGVPEDLDRAQSEFKALALRDASQT